MCQRILSILLIGATLFGQSFCCCMMESASIDSPKSCCCPVDNSAKQSSGNSGKQQHECECRQHRAIAARLTGESLLLTAPSAKWLIELAQYIVPICIGQLGDAAPRSLALSELRSAPHRDGSGILLVICVRRC